MHDWICYERLNSFLTESEIAIASIPAQYRSWIFYQLALTEADEILNYAVRTLEERKT